MIPTEKDLILARREGFLACFEIASWHRQPSGWSFCQDGSVARLSVEGGIEAYVAKKYPLPAEEVPNEVADPDGDKWRWFGGRLQIRKLDRGNWLEVGLSDITETSRPTIAKVMAQPRVPVR